MGSIKPTYIKRTSDAAVKRFPGRFKPDFEHNKKELQLLIVSEELNCPSKAVRNRLAGHLVRYTRPRENMQTYRPTFAVKKKIVTRRKF